MGPFRKPTLLIKRNTLYSLSHTITMGQAICPASVGTSALCVAGVHKEPIASCALWNVSDTQQRIAVRIVPVLRLASELAHPRVRRCFALVGLATRVMRRRCIARASCVLHTRFRARALVTVSAAELLVLHPGNSLTSCIATVYQAFHKYSNMSRTEGAIYRGVWLSWSWRCGPVARIENRTSALKNDTCCDSDLGFSPSRYAPGF